MLERVIHKFKVLALVRNLLLTLVVRDFKARYAGSFMGFFWAIAVPFINMCFYIFIFSYVLKIKTGIKGIEGFGLFIISGFIPWLGFQEALTRAASCMIENSFMIKKISFPLDVIPLYVVSSAAVNMFIAWGVFLIYLVVDRGIHSPWALMIIPLTALQLLITLGLSFFLAAIGVFVRDVAHLIGVLLLLWMYATPIIYPLSMVPQALRRVLLINPLTHLVDGYRATLLLGKPPDWGGMAYLTLFAVLSFLFGYWVFTSSKEQIPNFV